MTENEEMAVQLVEAALPQLKDGEPRRALWRLVDAAGLLMEDALPEIPEGVGQDNATGRGFYLCKR